MRKIKCIIILFFVVITYNIAYSQIKANKFVNVGILLNTESVVVASSNKYYIQNSNKKIALSAGKATIRLADNNIIIGKKKYSLPVHIYGESYILVNDKIYRGSIIIKLSRTNKLNIINKVDIEDYIKGVLPKELGASYPIESLKAQAVISRTYAIKNINKHKKDGFNLCSQVDCQVYGGSSFETKKTNKAVVDTKGEVILYNSKLAQTLFHANCGGHTENPYYVWRWNSKIPEYLKGKKDKYCASIKWSCKLKSDFIYTKLKNAGYKIGTIKSIKTKGKTPGKAREFVIVKHKKGTLKLDAYKFRSIVNPSQIKSTMIESISKQGQNFIFKGVGSGHKVGLCQYGSKTMADKGFNYIKILKFYYPKTTIEKVKYE